MILLHGGFYDCRLVVWGETPGTPGVNKSRKGRTSVQFPVFPFGADKKQLTEILRKVLGEKTMPGGLETWSVWVPTVGNVPLASSPLIAENPEPSDKAVFRAWSVPGLALSGGPCIDFLGRCAGKEVLEPGVVVGKDLSFWAAVLRFAGSLAARQQYLPGMVEDHGRFRSRWRPVFAGADAQTLSKLVGAMPVCARAFTKEEGTFPEGSGIAVVTDFIGTIVDYLARSTPPGGALGLRVPARSQKKRGGYDSLHDQWLYSLRTPDGGMEGKETELQQFAEQIRQWYRQISLASDSPFRLCFRLEEPIEEVDKNWFLRYLLQ